MKALLVCVVAAALAAACAAAGGSSSAANTMTLVGFNDAFCQTAVAWNQSYAPERCYSETLPLGVTGSYTAACAPNSLSGNCVTINAFGDDSSCGNSSIVRPEAFPCGACLSFVPGVHEVFENCEGGAPIYKSGCDATCSVCLATTNFAPGQCHDLRTMSKHPLFGTYYSLGGVQTCDTIVTFHNYAGTQCDGLTAYVQPVPVGLCVNGTIVYCDQ